MHYGILSAFGASVKHKLQKICREGSGFCSESPEFFLVLRQHDRLFRDIQTYHRHRDSGSDHHFCCIWIYPDIELCCGGYISADCRTAHKPDIGDMLLQVRMQAQRDRDVCHRACHEKFDLSVLAGQFVNQFRSRLGNKTAFYRCRELAVS